MQIIPFMNWARKSMRRVLMMRKWVCAVILWSSLPAAVLAQTLPHYFQGIYLPSDAWLRPAIRLAPFDALTTGYSIAVPLWPEGNAASRKKGSALTFPKQVVGGCLRGVLYGFGCGLVGMGLLADVGGNRNADVWRGFAIGGYLGYNIGCGMGSHSIGERAGMKSPLAASLIGSALGSAVGYATLKSTKHGWGMVVNPPLFAAIAFHFAIPGEWQRRRR